MDAASANAFGAVCVSMALLCATASPAPCFSQGTPEQRLACAPGVFRPCRCLHPQCDEMTACLREKSAELTDACKTATEVGMKQLPRVSDGTGARKRHRKIRIGEIPVHKMKFALVNTMAPRNPSVCAECLRPLERGYFTRSFHLKALLRGRVLPRWMVASGFVGSVAPTNPFELAIAWPKPTVDVASALFDSAWSNHGG
jgi:hypothetical protein